MEDGTCWCEGPTLLLLYSLMPAQDFSEADASGCCILLVKSGKVLFCPARWMNFLFFASIVLPNWEQGRVDMVVVWDGKQFWLMYHPVMERAVYCVFFVARKCAFMIARLRCVQIISKRAWISQKIPLVTSTWPLHQCTAKSGTYHQLGFGLKLSPQKWWLHGFRFIAIWGLDIGALGVWMQKPKPSIGTGATFTRCSRTALGRTGVAPIFWCFRSSLGCLSGRDLRCSKNRWWLVEWVLML